MLDVVLSKCDLQNARVRASEKGTLVLCAVMAVVMLTVGIGLAVSGVRLGVWLALVGVLFAGGAGYFAWHRGTLVDPHTHPVFVLLRDRAQEVVWVRRVRFPQGPLVDYVYLHLESGGSGGFLMLPRGDVDALMAALSAGLPHATFGHDPELARKYAQDPRQLRRAAA